MKRFSLSSFFIGIGLGMILSSILLVSWNKAADRATDIRKIPDEIVIERAKELGLIDPGEGIDKKSMENMMPKE